MTPPAPVQQTYEIPTPTILRMFQNLEQFEVKLRKHVLSPGEPWARLFGVQFLRQIGQKLKAGDVSGVAEAYPVVAEVVARGVGFAAGCPVYVRVREAASGPHPERVTYFFVAEPGFKVVAHGGAVRTAFFLGKHPRESKYTLFQEAWRSIRVRALARPVRGAPPQAEATLFSPRNWDRCPNPHPRPTRPMRPQVRDWLDRASPPDEER